MRDQKEMVKLFPSGIAIGDAFCNREEERHTLKKNIDNIEHTVLLAPRRYGKTSLSTKVVDEINIQHAWIEMFSITSFETAAVKVTSSIAELIYQLSPDIKKLQLLIKKFFKKLKPEIVLGGFGQKVVLHPLSNPIETITEILLELDKYALSLDKRAVVVFDEFQQIAMIKDGHAIEACIRQAVERSQVISYIFSGSNRHMLSEMFGNSSRPLYRLCKLITLDRIHEKSYIPFIQKAAIEKWGEELESESIQQILTITERHPFYMNVLCEQLWKLEALPNEDVVSEMWRAYVFHHKTIIISETLDLSINQKKCLSALANHPTKEPSSIEFQIRARLSASSLRQTLKALTKKDLIYKDEGHVTRLLDPAIAYLLNQDI